MKDNKIYWASPTSIVGDEAVIGEHTKIWQFSNIMDGAVIGSGCNIGQNVFIESGVRIGNRVKIKNNISLYSGVVCEDDVFLGPNAVFTNVVNPRSFIERKHEFKTTIIQEGATIGANATILCGHKIGRFAMIGAGTVVTKDVEDYELVVGNPGKKIGYVCKCGGRLNSNLKCQSCGSCYKNDGKEGGVRMEFIDLKAQYQVIKNEIDENVKSIIENAAFINGKEVEQFEKELAKYIGKKECITCGNGTDALELIYLAYGIGKNDAIFCPAMTFIASVEPACMLGATAVFCDIDKNTYNLSPESLKKRVEDALREGKLTPKAVVAVDFLGNPFAVEEIKKICNHFHLLLIEDAAQGLSAECNGKKCGSFGDIAATSFFPSKPLGCYGDGGAIFTDDNEIADLIRSLKVHGKGNSKYDNVRLGINSRLDTLQAGILLAKLHNLEKELTERQKIAKIYSDTLSAYFKVPYVRDTDISSYAQFIIQARSSEERKFIMNFLDERRVPSLIYYPKPLHKMSAFSNEAERYENAEEYAECNFGIPFSPYLLQEDQKKVIETLVEAVKVFRN